MAKRMVIKATAGGFLVTREYLNGCGYWVITSTSHFDKFPFWLVADSSASIHVRS